MSLRKLRTHKIGISNIDFRTKNEQENLNLYEPWKVPKDFGTMGQRNYRNPIDVSRQLFSSIKKITTQKDIVNDYPDPRFFTTAQFYKNHKIKMKYKTVLNSERVSQLEEVIKGKDVFTGDNKSFAEIFYYRNGKKFNPRNLMNKDLNTLEEQKNQKIRIDKLAKEKKFLNKNANNETQLVKINAHKTQDDFINIDKIKEITMALRRRYGNRTDANKIFNIWARTFKNKITVYDAYKMLNYLNIPANYNEAKAFIASGSNSGADFMNIEEFSNMIFDDNLGQYLKESKNDEKILIDKNEEKKFNDKMLKVNKEKEFNRNLNSLKDFISSRIILFNKKIKEISKEKYTFLNNGENEQDLNICNYEKFKQGVLNLRPTENFGKEEYIKALFDEYKDKNNLVDIRYFDNTLYERTKKEPLFNLKDRLLEKYNQILTKKKEGFKTFVEENKKYKSLVYQKKYDLDNQIKFKKEYDEEIKNEEEERLKKEINGTVPSTQWIQHIYENRREHFKILNRIEHSLSARNTINSNLKHYTRFGSNPKWKNTADIMVGDKFASTYINEKDRFCLDRNVARDDKLKKERISTGRQKRIQTAIQKYEQNKYIKEMLQDEKAKFSDTKKCMRQTYYGDFSKVKNFIIE